MGIKKVADLKRQIEFNYEPYSIDRWLLNFPFLTIWFKQIFKTLPISTDLSTIN